MVAKMFWNAARWPLVAIMAVLTVVVVILGVGIQANTDRLENAVYAQCLDVQKAAAGTNVVVETLITATETFNTSPSFTVAERADRIVKYKKAIQPIRLCAKPE